ncbi:hypothetical protein [Streptomyces sp. IBSBF 3136]|uniref:hypothetical protein n=1 Tax=Streptomyces sp. IBSBF 3136 TaxID=2903524 RepID=UPI002FDBE191
MKFGTSAALRREEGDLPGIIAGAARLRTMLQHLTSPPLPSARSQPGPRGGLFRC